MGAPGFDKAKYRQQTLSRYYASLKATVLSMRREVEGYLDDVPDKHKPEFSWYYQNLNDAFEAISRAKPDFNAAKPHWDERDISDIRRTLAAELELDEK